MLVVLSPNHRDKLILLYSIYSPQKQIGKLCSIEQDLAVAIGAKGGKVDHMRNMYPILVDEVRGFLNSNFI